MHLRARSLVDNNLRSETIGSRFESGCYVCIEVSSLQLLPTYCLSVCEAGRSDSEELKKGLSSFPSAL